LQQAQDDGATEEERKTFLDGAERLIAKHMIETSELAEVSDITERIIDRKGYGNLASSIGQLYSEVGQLHGVTVLTQPGVGRGRLKLYLYGTKTHLDLLDTLMDFLIVQLINDTNRFKPRSRKSYGFGWSAAVLVRMKETRHAVESECSALVPTTERSKSAAEDRWGKLRQLNSNDEIDPFDLHVGRIDGKNADIGATKLDG